MIEDAVHWSHETERRIRDFSLICDLSHSEPDTGGASSELPP